MHKAKFMLVFFWMLTKMDVCAQTEWNQAVVQGLRFQAQADSMQRLIEAKVSALSTIPESQRNGIRTAIRNDEAQAAALQKTANEWFARAVALEGTLVTAATSKNATLTQEKESDANEELEENRETKDNREPEFAVLSKSPYSAANPVPVNVPLPDGVAYKIQLGAFSKQLPANAFKGLTPISGEKLPNGVTKYYAGLFWRFADADDALRKVRENGFKDAFIVAFFNQKTINTERARQLEENSL